ncbi:MAG: flavin reductase family protein [Acidimicrobiia bacterium]
MAFSSPYLDERVLDGVVGLLIVEASGRANAMTVSFFSEGAHHPTSLWVSISRTTHTYTLLSRTDRFSLAVLSRGQRDIALLCGTTSGREHDKCAALKLYRSPGGFLFLEGALASTACTVRRAHPVDDHSLLIGDIVESELDPSTVPRS